MLCIVKVKEIPEVLNDHIGPPWLFELVVQIPILLNAGLSYVHS